MHQKFMKKFSQILRSMVTADDPFLLSVTINTLMAPQAPKLFSIKNHRTREDSRDIFHLLAQDDYIETRTKMNKYISLLLAQTAENMTD